MAHRNGGVSQVVSLRTAFEPMPPRHSRAARCGNLKRGGLFCLAVSDFRRQWVSFDTPETLKYRECPVFSCIRRWFRGSDGDNWLRDLSDDAADDIRSDSESYGESNMPDDTRDTREDTSGRSRLDEPMGISPDCRPDVLWDSPENVLPDSSDNSGWNCRAEALDDDSVKNMERNSESDP